MIKEDATPAERSEASRSSSANFERQPTLPDEALATELKQEPDLPRIQQGTEPDCNYELCEVGT